MPQETLLERIAKVQKALFDTVSYYTVITEDLDAMLGISLVAPIGKYKGSGGLSIKDVDVYCLSSSCSFFLLLASEKIAECEALAKECGFSVKEVRGAETSTLTVKLSKKDSLTYTEQYLAQHKKDESKKRFQKDFVQGKYLCRSRTLAGMPPGDIASIFNNIDDYEIAELPRPGLKRYYCKPVGAPTGVLAQGGEKALISLIGHLANMKFQQLLGEVYGGEWDLIQGANTCTSSTRYKPNKLSDDLAYRASIMRKTNELLVKSLEQHERLSKMVEAAGGSTKFKKQLIKDFRALLPMRAALWLNHGDYGTIARKFLSGK